MGIIKSWHYLKGYVIIKIKGLTLERFLNLAANKDIYLWDIKRVDYTVVEMKTTIDDFRRLREIVKKTDCQVEIIEKIGLPFLIYKFRERKMLGIGILVFFTLVFTLFSIIWDVEIIGNKIVETRELMDFLHEHGIDTGVIKYKIDTNHIEELLLREFEIFSFVNLEAKGTKLVLEVKEQALPPEQLDKSEPCNIIASKKGVILKTVVRNGEALVRKGDIVQEGQLLVSGVIQKEDEYMAVHADGEILAQTRYSLQLETPIMKTIEEETGRSIKFQEIKIGDKSFQFFREDVPYEHYRENIREVEIFNNKIKLPFQIYIHEYEEVELKEVKQNIDFLKQSSYIEGISQLNEKIPKDAEIQSKDVDYMESNGVLTTYIVVEAIEDIGMKQRIN